MKNDNYEVILAIVDEGFADDVMDVAREQGARGGTIINARGVARADAAEFFGITVHAEKEIVMIVVPKKIKDNILNAIYKEMGMAKKAKGIAFSMPITDILGIVDVEEQKEKIEA